MTYESDLEAADRAARENVQGAYGRALVYMDAMLSGKRIAGNVIFNKVGEEGAA